MDGVRDRRRPSPLACRIAVHNDVQLRQQRGDVDPIVHQRVANREAHDREAYARD